jgi:hypothetical protein
MDMVRTGTRATTLKGLLASSGLRPAASARPAPQIEALPAELTNAVMMFYRTLGGRSDAPLYFRPGQWHLAFEDGLVVELDEELHFNRYRHRAVEADWSSTLPWRDDYLTFCREQESRCIAAGKWGKRWTNPPCEAIFGAPDPPGVLGPRGAPRWKQRALYDMIKDAFALSDSSVRLARLATYDYIDGVELGAALQGHAVLDISTLAALVERRST